MRGQELKQPQDYFEIAAREAVTMTFIDLTQEISLLGELRLLVSFHRDPADDTRLFHLPGLKRPMMEQVIRGRRMPAIIQKALAQPCQLVCINCKSCYHRAPAVCLLFARVLEVLYKCRVLLALPVFARDWQRQVLLVDDVLRVMIDPRVAQLGCLPFLDPRSPQRIFVESLRELEEAKVDAQSFFTQHHGPITLGPRPKAFPDPAGAAKRAKLSDSLSSSGGLSPRSPRPAPRSFAEAGSYSIQRSSI